MGMLKIDQMNQGPQMHSRLWKGNQWWLTKIWKPTIRIYDYWTEMTQTPSLKPGNWNNY